MPNERIADVIAWEALDSRGTPTLGCAVTLEDGSRGSTIVPSGASTGTHDARENRDASWGGLGLVTSIGRIAGSLRAELLGQLAGEADSIIASIDPSPNLDVIGVHAALGISVAATRARAASVGVPLHALLSAGKPPLLPMPMINIVSGGAHAGQAIDIQDVLVVPVGARSFREALEWAWQARRSATAIAEARGMPAGLVADEGGLGLPLSSNRAALDLVTSAIEHSGLIPGDQVSLAVDVAANQMWDGRCYRLAADNRSVDAAGMIDEVRGWLKDFPLVSVEDPLHDGDWTSWQEMTASYGSQTQLLGDDLFATSSDRVQAAVADNIANAVLVKPNQRGTLSRAADAVTTAQAAGYNVVVSARSGDTEDGWLADLAVGWRAGQIKVGSTTRSERTAKWNRLLQIEAEAGDSATFAQPHFR